LKKGKNAIGLAGWLLVSFAAAWIGSRYMPGPWYESLAKPAWIPPNDVFAPVWTVLYVLMGVAAWLVWKRAGFKGAGVALTLFVVQLVLNALWSYVFFGLHRISAAFVDIAILWVAILAVTVLFWRIVRLAGVLMFPYLAWVGFASVLNFVLWHMNRGSGV
jgi:tryptophan-rich sensory protein